MLLDRKDHPIVEKAYTNNMTANMQNKSMSLDSAPDHVKLAVDLIALLEENEIPNDTAIAALKIVLKDFQQKASSSTGSEPKPSPSAAD